MPKLESWIESLPSSHRLSLNTAIGAFIDTFLSGYHRAELGESISDIPLVRELNPDSRSPEFIKQYFISFLTVVWKLTEPRHRRPVLECDAERRAFATLIEEAKAIIEDEGIDQVFDEFKRVVEEASPDDERKAGRSEPVPIERVARENRWFESYSRKTNILHPYISAGGEH